MGKKIATTFKRVKLFPGFSFRILRNKLANAEIWDPMKHSTGNVELYPKHSMGLGYLPA